MRTLIALLVLVVGCGDVTMEATAGGAAGEGGHLEAMGGAGGRLEATGGQPAATGGAAGTGDQLQATGGAGGHLEATGGAGGSAAPVCISNSTPGFAFNGTCEGGSPTSKGCHAACELDGAHFVGCAAPSSGAAVTCYGSCADCPQ